MANIFKAKTLVSRTGIFSHEAIAPNLVYNTGYQNIDGIKNFYNTPTINGDGILSSGQDIIGGDLTGDLLSATINKLQGYPLSINSPTAGQTLLWNGSTWVPGANANGGGGGGGKVYFFNFSNHTGIAPSGGLPTNAYHALSLLGRNYDVGSGSFTSPNLTPQDEFHLVTHFVTASGDPGVRNIPAGLWDFNIWANTNSTSATQTQMKAVVNIYDPINSSYRYVSESDAVYLYDSITPAQYILNVTMPQTGVQDYERIYVQLFGKKTNILNRTITFYFDSYRPSHVHTTLPSVAGSGVVKVIDGIYQTPASAIVDVDVDNNANIKQSKIQNLTTDLASLNSQCSVLTTNLISTGAYLNEKINSLSGYVDSQDNNKINSLSGVSVLTFGDQTISGIKTFAENTVFGDPSQGDFLVISGNTFTIYGSGNFINGLFVSGVAVLTGVDLSSYATVSNLNSLSGYINSSSSNIVFTTGNQTISSNKTFLDRLSAKTGFFGDNNFASGDWIGISAGSGNYVSGNYAFIAGGNCNRVNANFSIVGGGCCNIVSGNFSNIGGGSCNAIFKTFSTIGGGCRNNADGNNATVAGGCCNIACGDSATVGGGSRNRACCFAATVGGGCYNCAAGDFAIVAGGCCNVVSASGATIGGGCRNFACGVDATIGGGLCNTACCRCATVAGGFCNRACANLATVGGGFYNRASFLGTTVGGGCRNTAYGNHATVGGGFCNCACCENATIGGGCCNIVCGISATIAGGFCNGAGCCGATVVGGTGNCAAGGNHATVGGGSLNRACGTATTIGGGCNNTACFAGATVAGGCCNIAFCDRATIGGGGSNAACNCQATVAGGFCNSACAIGATVGGGSFNCSNGLSSTVGGGCRNNAFCGGATVGGGYCNFASGNLSFVGGGCLNTAADNLAIIGGGYNNRICGSITSTQSSTIVGGIKNILISSPLSIIGGGSCNCTVSGNGSTIAGGCYNRIFSSVSNIGGGCCNCICSNSTSSTIGGGFCNRSACVCGTVGGGNCNVACGTAATVGGGSSNIACCTATVGGGCCNNAAGNFSAIGGGCCNCAAGPFSNIGGGCCNRAICSYGNVGGGRANCNCACFSTIGGGCYNNTFDSCFGVVGGGGCNRLCCSCFSTIGGGCSNLAFCLSNFSTVGGGCYNRICCGSLSSTIGGGEKNCVLSNFGYIPGGRCSVVQLGHSGAAVLGDGENRAHNSFSAHSLTLDFASGVYFSNKKVFGAVPEMVNVNNNFTISNTFNSDMILANSSSTITGTIISGNATGFNASIIQIGAGKIEITGSGIGVLISSYNNQYKTAGQFATISLLHTGSNGYIMYGNTSV